jgi:type VI secretion system secreted protein VgrG
LKDATSYLSPYSNIVLLHDLYQTRAYNSNLSGRQEVILKHYVQGIGTLVDLGEDGFPIEDGYQKDDLMGSASGRGLRGVISRVEQALTHVAKQLQKLLATPGTQLGVLTIDVFGFSRGATAARHCLNELLRPVQKGSKELPYGRLGKALAAVQVPLPRRLNLRFAGLFDTVVSDAMSKGFLEEMGIELAATVFKFEAPSVRYEVQNSVGSGNSYKLEPIYTSLKDFPGKSIHITAGDDYRENFPLTLNDAPNRLDLDLFGAHSDVGGGYEVDDSNTVVEYGDYIYLQGLRDNTAKQKLLDVAAVPHRERFTRVLKNGRWVVDNPAQRTKSQRRILAELDLGFIID